MGRRCITDGSWTISARRCPLSGTRRVPCFLEHTAYRRFNKPNLVCLEEKPDRVEELRRQFAKLPRRRN
ncbi:hypothetical protein [Streptomyces spiralis]|uniref:hypothetical protein n=1 Tax=Streptomyces spiralis TaxID=66376 RepID=UPI0036782C56